MGTPSPPHLYSVRDACQLLFVSRLTLYALMGTDQPLSLNIGSVRRITSSELCKFISDRQQEDYPWNTRDNSWYLITATASCWAVSSRLSNGVAQ